ncbi:MAG TPA: M14 family zinc carboxypeptidase [Actinomycetota bacterium]|nr:M14 family zinc carboxypeptidase [Actinomycetota bacterium]
MRPVLRTPSRPLRLIGIMTAGAVALVVLPAKATPVCPDDPTLCGGRIFPEAQNSIDFVQHNDDEYLAGIQALEEAHPKFVRVSTLADLLNDEDAVSFGGHDIWVVEITNFNVPERRKLPVMVSLSVHGPERAGLEGGVRYMEDLATWADDEPDRKLMNGTEKDSTKVTVQKAMKKVHLYLSNINPDGWEAGDNENGNVYVRGNDNGIDLNREFPTMGWVDTSYTPLSEPESKGWDKLTKRIDPVAATDLHGELDSANGAFTDLMYPAGEWNLREQTQEERLARHMMSNVERYFEEDGVVLGDIAGTGDSMIPAQYATGYDVVGYDDSGFMGDYFTQRSGALEMDCRGSVR